MFDSLGGVLPLSPASPNDPFTFRGYSPIGMGEKLESDMDPE